jgi:hypothetical protein
MHPCHLSELKSTRKGTFTARFPQLSVSKVPDPESLLSQTYPIRNPSRLGSTRAVTEVPDPEPLHSLRRNPVIISDKETARVLRRKDFRKTRDHFRQKPPGSPPRGSVSPSAPLRPLSALLRFKAFPQRFTPDPCLYPSGPRKTDSAILCASVRTRS